MQIYGINPTEQVIIVFCSIFVANRNVMRQMCVIDFDKTNDDRQGNRMNRRVVSTCDEIIAQIEG